jgi:hypothetical protein
MYWLVKKFRNYFCYRKSPIDYYAFFQKQRKWYRSGIRSISTNIFETLIPGNLCSQVIVNAAPKMLHFKTFYILLTVHHVMILDKWPTWGTILFYVSVFIFNSLHISSTSCWSSGETNCVNTTFGNCHSVLVTVSCAGRKFTSAVS